ncbi:hypothetical protein L3X38_027677 [Prunus dulcis]|uniref:Uncharacterized protein n=1 Tax=Prunus dulcis TaxID=3755 RepID=A0AAD4VND7_PRUDU|nr:hypothetical protein L3X38_027677 [Prunus dulcis]
MRHYFLIFTLVYANELLGLPGRNNIYDSSIGGCHDALHCSCPKDVVKLTNADLVDPKDVVKLTNADLVDPKDVVKLTNADLVDVFPHSMRSTKARSLRLIY